MAKGYWIARVDIRVQERYHEYVSAAKVAFDKYGAKFLARGGGQRLRKARPAPATSSSNSTASRQPRPAITRRNIRSPQRSGRKSPMAKSCWSRAPEKPAGALQNHAFTDAANWSKRP